MELWATCRVRLGFTYREFMRSTLAEVQAMLDVMEGDQRADFARFATLQADIRNGPLTRPDKLLWTPYHLGLPEEPRKPEDKALWATVEKIEDMMKRRDYRMVADRFKRREKRTVRSGKHPRSSKR